MNEASKVLRHWSAWEKALLEGVGIDIGCGSNPVTAHAKRFDLEDGDANCITDYVFEQFDFVFSSHCLEHMRNPHEAIQEWWQLVKPGGHFILIVPDEDLYEQGVFPSRFNQDHKFTFTISKAQSWSPVSINVLELLSSLPDGKLVSLVLQDHGYDRRLYRHGPIPRPPRWLRMLLKVQRPLSRRWGVLWPPLERAMDRYRVVDQSLGDEPLGQIQGIVQKLKKADA
jgi:SAM-dependent methyltransferase